MITIYSHIDFIISRNNKMSQCTYILKNGERCKRTTQPGSKYCWQHQAKTQKKSLKKKSSNVKSAVKQNILDSKHILYLSLLPSELLDLLLLNFNSDELLTILPELEKLPEFSKLFRSKTFWNAIWRRDISLFLNPPSNVYEKYREIFNELSKISIRFLKISYFAITGYDILLFSLLDKRKSIELVKLLLDRGANNYNETMASAAIHGHIRIVELMLDRGANNYNKTMIAAAEGGYIEIVKLMLEKGANDYNRAMAFAALQGHIDIVKLMLERGANNYNWTMENAASKGHIDIVRLMLDLGANNYSYAIVEASDVGYNDIVTLIKSYKNR